MAVGAVGRSTAALQLLQTLLAVQRSWEHVSSGAGTYLGASSFISPSLQCGRSTPQTEHLWVRMVELGWLRAQSWAWISQLGPLCHSGTRDHSLRRCLVPAQQPWHTCEQQEHRALSSCVPVSATGNRRAVLRHNKPSSAN